MSLHINCSNIIVFFSLSKNLQLVGMVIEHLKSFLLAFGKVNDVFIRKIGVSSFTATQFYLD